MSKVANQIAKAVTKFFRRLTCRYLLVGETGVQYYCKSMEEVIEWLDCMHLGDKVSIIDFLTGDQVHAVKVRVACSYLKS